MTALRILIADDQPLVRAGLRTVLESEGIAVVGEAGDGRQAVTSTTRLRPDVVLMDIRMPELDGIEATRRIRVQPSSPPVLLLTTFDMDEYVYAGLRAGASGFLLKDTLASDLVAAIRAVVAGDAVVAPAATRRLIERFLESDVLPEQDRLAALDVLTAREREVLGLVARGLSNAEIAAMLFLAEGTVKTHVGRVLGKLGLRDRVQAVVLAYEIGVVRPAGSPAALSRRAGR